MRRILLGAVLFTLSLSAQPKLQLSVDTIMRGPALAGYTPRAVRWSRDSQEVYFEWKQASDPVEEQYDTYVATRNGSVRKLSEEEAKHAVPRFGRWTRDGKRAVFVENGDVFLYEAKRRRALTDTNDTEADAHFTQDEKRVAFRRGNNLFVLSLVDGSLVQLTNIVNADEKTLFDDENKDKTASQKWVAEEAKKLSEVLARRTAEEKEEKEKRKRELAIAPLKLKKGESVASLRLTPDEQYVIAFISTEGENDKRTAVPTYVTESGYTDTLGAREKVGDARPASRVASISVKDGKVNWLVHELRSQENAQQSEKTETVDAAKEPPLRAIELEDILFSKDGTRAVLPVRAADNKDWWLLAFDPATAKTRVLFNEHDDAWVRWQYSDIAGFLPDNRTLWFLSERTGWMHLYTVPFEGGEPRALTSGKYEVDDVVLAEDEKSFYFTSSQDSLFERHLYRMAIAGGTAVKLTKETGWHNAVASPDGKSIADLCSYTNKPTELYVNGVRATNSPAPDFQTYAWMDVPIVHVPARDGVQVPARLYKPANWNGGPAVIFVHGAGYLQNVHRGWSSYFREYMFHHLLNERGFLVLDVDYRASAGYGRDWRTAIYRHMGGVDLNDQVDA
ncbi:MAG: DPP IV N-terminal domain-containing protein, partial [Thermoanaerobaculia bacterium]